MACIVIKVILPVAGSELGLDIQVQFGFGSNLDLGSDRVHGVSSVVIVKVCMFLELTTVSRIILPLIAYSLKEFLDEIVDRPIMAYGLN